PKFDSHVYLLSTSAATWAHVADTCAHVADTWHATWRTRSRPDPDPAQARSLTGPPTTVDRWSGVGQRWSSGSQRWWRLGEWEDDTSDGTVAAAEKSVRVQGSEKKSILEGDVAQCNWWIKNISAAMKNDQNTLRSRSLIGWSLGLTKMPPAPIRAIYSTQ
nr:hypothetical protein [Tanacetum cinerariifolium]